MSIALRKIRKDDADLLFAWVNRPDSLAGKLRTQRPIARAEHDAWFRERLADPDCRLWIVMVDDEPVGQLRFSRGGDGWEVDIYIEPTLRRQGLARVALAAGTAALRRERPGVRILARVKHGNDASRHLFERSGFRLVANAHDHVLLAAAPNASEGDRWRRTK